MTALVPKENCANKFMFMKFKMVPRRAFCKSYILVNLKNARNKNIFPEAR